MKAIDLFEINIQRAEKLLKIHESAHAKGRPPSTGESDDILRAVVVFAVSALDAYFHMRITEVVRKIIYKNKRIPHKSVSYIEKNFPQEKRVAELLKIAIGNRPHQDIIKLLEKSLSGLTFQKPEQLEKGFGIMDINDPWKKLNHRLKLKGGTPKAFLIGVSNRRDDIVHEGDVYISPKYHGKLRKINRTWTRDCLKKMRELVGIIEIVSEVK